MKVLLVRPPVPVHTIGLKNIMICEPLELEYVAGNLIEEECMIFDSLVERNFEKRLKSFKPDVVVSSCYKSGTNEVIKLMRQVKSFNPKIITVVGGVHATLVPEDFSDPSIDIIGIGDGTEILPKIIECIKTGATLHDVGGLAFPIGDKLLLRTKSKAYMPPEDTLPLPRRDLISHLKDKYYYLMHQPVATMKTTWGCWYKCNFCFTWKITDGHPYSRSPENIVQELLTIEAEDVYIVDDIFLINKSRLRKLADLIIEHNIKKKYLVYARADFISQNEDVIAEWAELGLSAVFIGLEATTDAELSSMDKDCETWQNMAAIKILKKYNIDTYGSLIPSAYYTQKDWARLWQFIQESGLYYINISPHTPLPGANIWDLYKDQITIPEDAHGLFDLSHMILPTIMPLKAYYRAMLKLYGKTILNLKRAKTTTQRTLPSIWSWKYIRILKGALKIGKQFYFAHNHHSPKQIAIATFKGKPVDGLSYESKFQNPIFNQSNISIEVNV